MNIRQVSTIKTGRGADLAFAMVVMAAYFSIFISAPTINITQIVLLIIFGVAYIAIGIYGYHVCNRSIKPLLPLVYFIVQIGIGMIIVYLGKGSRYNTMILLPLAGQSVVILSRGWILIINALLLISFVCVLLDGDSHNLLVELPIFLAAQVFIVYFTQMAVNEEKARSNVERLVHELSEANLQLRMYANNAEELAIAKERNRLAREIHDGLGHYLTTVFLQIEAARSVMERNPQQANEAMKTAQRLTQEALGDVRKSVASLRVTSENEQPLEESVEGLIKNYRSIGIQGELTILGIPRALTPHVKLTLFRAAQEGVSNACKHAHPKNIWITIDYRGEHSISLNILDDGQGAEKFVEGYGIKGLQERVNILNGRLTIDNRPGSGFALDIEVPG